jgi:hypothetical protein
MDVKAVSLPALDSRNAVIDPPEVRPISWTT